MKVQGVSVQLQKLEGISGQEMIAQVGAALYVAGNAIQVDAQTSITEGAISGKGHIPSLPGQPPKADTHHLANNIETVRTEPLKVIVASNAAYSAPLEFGSSRIAPRPFMRPAAQRNRQKVQALIQQVMNRLVGQTE